jgi:CBS domain containing-hemolysin-like protein
MDRVPDLLNIFFVLLLVFANGFFVAVEFALVRSHPTKLRSPEMKDRFGVKASLALLDDLDLSLSATQFGITIASLVLGWWGEVTFANIIVRWLGSLEPTSAHVVSHGIATVLAFTIVTILHVVLGELVAKSLAIRYPETVILLLADLMRIFTSICRPIIYFLTATANMVLRLFGITRAAETERVHSLAELAMLVSHSTEQGMLDKTEEEMLKGIFGFSETIAREVMTPRTDLITIPVGATVEEVSEIVTRSGFSRFPVVGESVDDVVGILLVRDLLPFIALSRSNTPREFSLRKIMREPYFVPGTKPIDDLLNEFKRRKIHIAVCLDEHGGVDGIVTLEDVIEEIVGDIFDESDVPEKDIVVQDNGDVLVDGGVLVADINTQLEFAIPEGDYDTIAGFIYTSLGRLPKQGDKIVIVDGGDLKVPPRNGAAAGSAEGANGNGREEGEGDTEIAPPRAEITVERVKGRRIESVRLQRFTPPPFVETAEAFEASEAKGIAPGKDA